MIYLSTQDFTGAFQGWLDEERRVQDLRGRIDIWSYESVPTRAVHPGRTTVFTDHDRFTPAHRSLAESLWDTLSASGVRCFNDPRRVLNRPQLLNTLHGEGINNFRAALASESLDHLRFPVFVREAVEHTGSLTRLLHNRRELEWHLHLLRTFGGFRASELLVVEFVDVSDGDGVFRKYAAFRVGDWIRPRYLEFSRRWMVKVDARIIRDAYLQEEAEFVRTDPHRETLRRAFDVAGITYGRADYGVKDGRVQIWEINTNAQVGAYAGITEYLAPEDIQRRRPVEDSFHHAFRDRLRAMIEAEDRASRPQIPLNTPRHLEAQLLRDSRVARRRRTLQNWLRGMRHSPGLRALAGAISGKR